MRCFLFVSLCLLGLSCNRHAYRNKQEITLPVAVTAADLRPHFEKELYRCVVDGKFAFKKFHLSGVLYLKNFADATTRVVFQSEMGNTFFDFGWDNHDSFKVFSIIDQMNKPALIKTLKKDFELLLLKHLTEQPSGIYHFNNDPSANFIRFELEKGFVYYVIDKERRLKSIENADEQHKVVIMDIQGAKAENLLPETIRIRHLTANFTIDLKKIIPDDTAE